MLLNDYVSLRLSDSTIGVRLNFVILNAYRHSNLYVKKKLVLIFHKSVCRVKIKNSTLLEP